MGKPVAYSFLSPDFSPLYVVNFHMCVDTLSFTPQVCPKLFQSPFGYSLGLCVHVGIIICPQEDGLGEDDHAGPVQVQSSLNRPSVL